MNIGANSSDDEDYAPLEDIVGTRLAVDICSHNQHVLIDNAKNLVYNCRLCFAKKCLLNAMENHQTQSFVDLIRRISQSGAEEITDARGYTPFLVAVECNATDVMMDLKNTYDINSRVISNDGNSAIHIAAKGGCWGAIKKLILRFEFNVEEQNTKGATALRVAVEHRQNALIKQLVKKSKSKIPTDLYAYVNNIMK